MGLKVEKVICESETEALDGASDTVRRLAHSLAMQKKSIILSGIVTSEDYDIAFDRELKKAWDEIKDLDAEGYLKRVIADMLIEGLNPDDVFGEEENNA